MCLLSVISVLKQNHREKEKYNKNKKKKTKKLHRENFEYYNIKAQLKNRDNK